MNDKVDDSEVETGEQPGSAAPEVETPPTDPAPPTPPPGESDTAKQTAAYKAAMEDERKKRQLAEKELERIQNEQATKDYDPLDPESVQTLVRTEAQKIADQQEAKRQADAEAANWETRIAEGRSKYPDAKIDEIVNDVTLPVSDAMAGVIKRSADGVDLLVHLNANRDLAQKIALMNPTDAAMEMGRISASIKDAGPQLSNAPDPITPVGSRSTSTKSTDEMSLSEYEAHMRDKRGGSVFPS